MSEFDAVPAGSISRPLVLPADSVRPDYVGRGIHTLSRVFQGYLQGGSWAQVSSPLFTANETQVVVFLLIDGLGDHFLQKHGQGSQLLSDRQGTLTSVFPSTTSSAVTTLLTGLEPCTHGLNGWHIREESLGGILAPLPLQLRGAGKLHVDQTVLEALFPYDNLFEGVPRPSIAVLPAHISNSAFTVRHYRGAEIRAYRSLTQLLDLTLDAARALSRRSGGGFVQAYYPELDALSHHFGCESNEAIREFWRVDRCYQKLRERLRSLGASCVVSADHGFIDSPADRLICLGENDPVTDMLTGPLWGERRSAFCQTREGAETDFIDWAAQTLQGVAQVVESEALIQHGFLGRGPCHPKLTERMGSHAILMEPGWTICDLLPGEQPHEMMGVHGGLSSAEMLVPLIVG